MYTLRPLGTALKLVILDDCVLRRKIETSKACLNNDVDRLSIGPARPFGHVAGMICQAERLRLRGGSGWLESCLLRSLPECVKGNGY